MKNILLVAFLFVVKFGITQSILNWHAQGINTPKKGANVVTTAMVTDSDNNLYFIGRFDGSLTTSQGSDTLTASNTFENYFVKYDSLGNEIWSKKLGKGYFQELKMNSSNELILLGGGNNETYFNQSNVAHAGIDNDLFVARFDTSGSYINHFTLEGEWGEDDVAKSLSLDDNDFIYFAGEIHDSIDFDPSANSYYLAPSIQGGKEIIITKYSPSGVLQWAHKLSGTDDSYVSSIEASDSQLFVFGGFEDSINLNTNSITSYTQSDSTNSIFLSSYDTQGNYEWSNVFSAYFFSAVDLTLDPSGNPIIIGRFADSIDFDNTSNSVVLGGSNSVYFCKYSNQSDLIWAKKISYSNRVRPFKIETDNQGNIYQFGRYSLSNTSVDPMVIEVLPPTVTRNIYISAYDSSANYLWGRGVGNSHENFSRGFTVSTNDRIYLSLGFKDSSIDCNPDTSVELVYHSENVENDVISCYKTDSSYQWSNLVGGISKFDNKHNDRISESIFDPFGNVLSVGVFMSQINFDSSSVLNNLVGFDTTSNSSEENLYITKHDSLGQQIWSISIGSQSSTFGYPSIQVDTAGFIYISGSFTSSVDFDPSSTSQFILNSSTGVTYLAKFSPNGDFINAINYDGNSNHCLRYDSNSIYESTSKYNTASTYIMTLRKFDLSLNLIWSFTITSQPYLNIREIVADELGNIYLCGEQIGWGTVDFDPSSNVASSAVYGNDRAIIVSYDSSGNYRWFNNWHDNTDMKAIGLAAKNDRIYFIGRFHSQMWSSQQSGVQISSVGPGTFLISYDTIGNILWHRTHGGFNTGFSLGYSDGEPSSITTDTAGNIVILGSKFGQVDFNYTSFPIIQSLMNDHYMLWYDSTGTFLNVELIRNSSTSVPKSIEISSTNKLLTSFEIEESINLDVNSNIPTVVNSHGVDAVIANYSIDCFPVLTFDSVSICNSYTWSTTGKTYYNSGIYSNTLSAINGCDSIEYLMLNIIPPDSSTIFHELACESYYWSENGNTYDSTGVYTVVYPTPSGCDSIITLDLVIETDSIHTTQVVSCDTFFWSSSGVLYDSSGIYSVTFPSATGCDSTVAIDLEIIKVEDTVLINNDHLATNQPNAINYQWYDCNLNVPIPWAIDSILVPLYSGSFSVDITYNGCTVTSDCYEFGYAKLQDDSHPDNLNIYPNPVDNTIKFETPVFIKSFKLYSSEGRLIMLKNENKLISEIPIMNIAKGSYILEIENNEYLVNIRFIKD